MSCFPALLGNVSCDTRCRCLPHPPPKEIDLMDCDLMDCLVVVVKLCCSQPTLTGWMRARGSRAGEISWPHGVKCAWGERQTLWARLRRPHLPVGPCWKGVLSRVLSERRINTEVERSGPCPSHSFCLALEQPRRSVGAGREGNVSSPLHWRGQCSLEGKMGCGDVTVK